MPNTTGRLALLQPIGTDPVSELRIAISQNAQVQDSSVQYITSTGATRPSPGLVARVHLASDTGVWSFDTGGKWVTVPTSIDTTPCYAQRTQNQVFAPGITKVSLNTVFFDPGNNFDAATNFHYTAPVTGYYQVHGQVCTTSAGASLQAQIYQANQAFPTLLGDQAASGQCTIVSGILQCVAGDFIDLRVFTNISATTTNSAGGCAMQVCRIA